eukprot:CAMPEP_0202731242 /NCGR_PEP_ID=MMETSP1385-20130828/187048_1 /ASSEMBLY_ACC=CAM_ASM_000861 /TAXON_ID=933848 /ORGANISM="Elphidium margaritaceum" /LENGTH=308 /DNA_ID=CAMNT_0049397535 /DNA_START=961 /DNA_END=1887 /DNA_ORIENTATION=+
MNELSLYRFDDAYHEYRLHATKTMSSSALVCNLLYLDILQLLLDTNTNTTTTTNMCYTFYDVNNAYFECDLYRKVLHDIDPNDIAPMFLRTMKLSFDETADLDRCCICLLENRSAEFTRISSCRHIFHYQCMKQLLLHKRSVINRPIWDRNSNAYVLCNFCHCPLCRQPFTKIQSRIACSASRPPTVQIINVSDIDHICDDFDNDDENEEEELATLQDLDDLFDDDDQESHEEEEDGSVHVVDSEVGDSSAIHGYQHFDELQNVPVYDEEEFGDYDELDAFHAAIDEEEELEATDATGNEDEYSTDVQ